MYARLILKLSGLQIRGGKDMKVKGELARKRKVKSRSWGGHLRTVEGKYDQSVLYACMHANVMMKPIIMHD